jgi:predicted helicase
VLVLDPATGTGTFLFEVIEQIRERFEKKHQAGLWPAYVHEHLLPRLFGFELLMAPYAVAHFKIGLELSGRHLPELWRETWAYHFQGDERVNIFLTNTLEDIQQITAQQGPLAIIGKEGNEAIAIKKHRPVLVVLGNPPYANFGRQNRNDFILGLLDDYKRGLKEKKINLNDDFIKFVRWAQWRIEQTGQGIIGFITNNVYLDGLTHRRMRESLLETFDEIYILNLHGSAKKQETVADGSKDDNVFDITVGVAIAIFVKYGRDGVPPSQTSKQNVRDADTASLPKKKKKNATIHHADLWGLRKNKYDWLNVHNATNTEWTTFQPDAPDFRFVPRNAKHEKEWNEAWGVHEIFPVNNVGLSTDRDELFFDYDKKELEKRITTFFGKELSSWFVEQYRVKDSSSYEIESRRRQCKFSAKAIQRCLYRPFDFRWLYYDAGLTSRPAEKVMRHLLAGTNFALGCLRQSRRGEDGAFFVAQGLIHKNFVSLYDVTTVFPLYLYPNGESEEQTELVPHENGRRPNLSGDFVKQFAETVDLKFIADGRGDLKKTFGPEDIFHYAYAIFHSQSYRDRYIEFLKLDFPRVPLCHDQQLFRKLCGCGVKLVALHTLQGDFESLVDFDTPGSNIVEQIAFVPANKEGGIRRDRVQINSDQYFEGISHAVWQMRIGGYQVCEKWLKDRKGRALTHDEIEHYQRTVSALAETRTLMAQIDSLISDHGGWPLE